jgi:hypothetical protein
MAGRPAFQAGFSAGDAKQPRALHRGAGGAGWRRGGVAHPLPAPFGPGSTSLALESRLDG